MVITQPKTKTAGIATSIAFAIVEGAHSKEKTRVGARSPPVPYWRVENQSGVDCP
jgi:hypothetical protein